MIKNLLQYKTISWPVVILALLALVIGGALFSVGYGELEISLRDIPSILRKGEGLEYMIISKIRIPRVILAIAVGGALSLAGALLQGIYRNPLVEPYTLGISGGAAFGVALGIVTGLPELLGAHMLAVCGFVGSIVVIFAVYLLSLKNGKLNINRMLLIGVMISFISSSGMMFLLSITDIENMHSIVFWIMGSLDEPSTALVYAMLGCAILSLIISIFFAQPLNALRLGEDKAKHLGINTSFIIKSLFVIASLLTGMTVAVAGIIGFVGLVIPQLVRILVGNDYRILLVTSFLVGSFFLIICDIVARTIIAPNELPIGVITGMIGGIAFIFLLTKQKNS